MNTKKKKFHLLKVPSNCDFPALPYVITDCILNLEERGLTTEGILRVSGNVILTKQLMKIYSKGKRVDLNQVDIHTVANLLKIFLRDLKLPIIPFEMYSSFVSIGENGSLEDTASKLRVLVEALPPFNQLFLHRVIEFLVKVSSRCVENKMDKNNLATLFGPILMRSNDLTPHDLLKNMASVHCIVALLISHFEEAFKGCDKECWKKCVNPEKTKSGSNQGSSSEEPSPRDSSIESSYVKLTKWMAGRTSPKSIGSPRLGTDPPPVSPSTSRVVSEDQDVEYTEQSTEYVEQEIREPKSRKSMILSLKHDYGKQKREKDAKKKKQKWKERKYHFLEGQGQQTGRKSPVRLVPMVSDIGLLHNGVIVRQKRASSFDEAEPHPIRKTTGSDIHPTKEPHSALSRAVQSSDGGHILESKKSYKSWLRTVFSKKAEASKFHVTKEEIVVQKNKLRRLRKKHHTELLLNRTQSTAKLREFQREFRSKLSKIKENENQTESGNAEPIVLETKTERTDVTPDKDDWTLVCENLLQPRKSRRKSMSDIDLISSRRCSEREQAGSSLFLRSEAAVRFDLQTQSNRPQIPPLLTTTDPILPSHSPKNTAASQWTIAGTRGRDRGMARRVFAGQSKRYSLAINLQQEDDSTHFLIGNRVKQAPSSILSSESTPSSTFAENEDQSDFTTFESEKPTKTTTELNQTEQTYDPLVYDQQDGNKQKQIKIQQLQDLKGMKMMPKLDQVTLVDKTLEQSSQEVSLPEDLST